MKTETNIGGPATPLGSMADARMSEARVMKLVRLKDLDDYEVASGDPDPRGWEVKALDGRTVGTVKHLLVDTVALRVRYLEVEVDALPGSANSRPVHVPVRSARLRDDVDEVIVDLGVAAIELLETAQLERDAEPGDATDEIRFFGQRRVGRDDTQYLVRRERPS